MENKAIHYDGSVQINDNTKIILTQFQSLTNRSKLLMKYEKVLVETHL